MTIEEQVTEQTVGHGLCVFEGAATGLTPLVQAAAILQVAAEKNGSAQYRDSGEFMLIGRRFCWEVQQQPAEGQGLVGDVRTRKSAGTVLVVRLAHV